MTDPNHLQKLYRVNVALKPEVVAALVQSGYDSMLSPTRAAQVILHEMFGVEPPAITPGRSHYKPPKVGKLPDNREPALADTEIKRMLKKGHSVAYICGTTKTAWRRVHDIKDSM
jgi:hypothetical protein